MTKTIKLSLAAVMAAGIATTATAANLEDAIKGVDVSGYVDYRLENKTVEKDSSKSFDLNEYSVNVTLTSKVNDIVKATVSAGFDEVTTGNNNTDNYGSYTADQDTSAPVGVDKAYFTFSLGATTVLAGKQDIPSAFVDKTDTVKQGAGVVALHTVNDTLTVAGAHFINNNIAKVYGLAVAAENTKTTELLALGKVAMVDYAVHYNMTDISGLYGGTDADHLYVKLGADVSGVKLGFKHATGSTDSADGTKWADASVTQLSAATKVGTLGLKAGYMMADKEQGTNAAQSDVALDGDNDADVHFKVWQLSSSAIANKGNGMMIGADMPVVEKVTVGATYAIATDDGVAAAKDTDYSELLLTATYKMSKNFTIHGRYSMLNKDTNVANGSVDTDYSRIQVKYTF
ncbi:MAG: major outer membrane protein [Arcobacteraceae bacterium]|jgi:hypothetical protein|nr:major outer membrane protein [Arcobacteraceae bacterium]